MASETLAGNAAAMREALDDILELIDKWRTDNMMEHWQYSQLFDIADAALAAPPRNCDRYSHDGALSVWAAEKENGKNGCFDEWLYAPATEQKGEQL